MAKKLESAADINQRVDKLLREAGAYGKFPTPVDDIVRAAKLMESADYVLDESLVKRAPAYLQGLLRSARGKIQGLVDRRARVIHVSPAVEHEGKRRFVKLHETVHHILPHQQEMLFADNHETLSVATDRLFEREANQGAAELLFQRDGFACDSNDMAISTDTVWFLAQRYGSSFHSALRRYAETHRAAMAAIVLDPTPRSMAPPTWRRAEVMSTPRWNEHFGTPEWPQMMRVDQYPFLARLEYPELDEVRIRNVDGQDETVQIDTCQTPYNSFVLLWQPERRFRRLRRVVRRDET